MFKQMAYVVSFSLLCSLVVALSLVPMLSAKILHPEDIDSTGGGGLSNKLLKKSKQCFTQMELNYQRLLRYFLDHRIIEFACRLPLPMKIRKGQGKWLLRQVLYKYVPKDLMERPKTGFGIPIDSWLRGPLRDWAENLLDESRLLREGYFHPNTIRNKWQEHLSYKHNWQYLLWDVLMFQAWLETQKS